MIIFKRHSGFSLIEVLVAFSIFAVSLGLILQIYSKGAASARLTDEYTNAMIIAQSRMANIATSESEQDINTEEFIDKYTVNTIVSDVEIVQPELELEFESNLVQRWIEIDVSWESLQKTRTVKLKTLKLFPAT